MNNLGYHDELEAELMLDEAREPDIDAIEEDEIERFADMIVDVSEPVVIGAFIKYLDKNGYNFGVLAGIRSLLRQPNGRKKECRNG